MKRSTRAFNDVYTGEHLNRIAFPMGGIGAGMICLEGTGALSHVSLRHQPEVFHEPRQFAALWVRGARYDAVDRTLILEPAVPGDFRAFLCTATGYGTVGRRGGQPFLDVVSGTIPVARIIDRGAPKPAQARIS